MKNALLLTLGFDEKFCYRAILRHGISEGDKIVLVTAKIVNRVKKAYDWIKTFVNTSYSNVEMKLIELNVEDTIGSIKKVLEILEELEGYHIVINLSGGMRILSFIVLLSLLFKEIRNAVIEIELEDFSGVVRIPVILLTLPSIKEKLSEEKIKILKTIRDGKNNVKSIAEYLNKDQSTIRRHISSLKKLGLIEYEKRKPLKVKPSKLLDLIL
ncbi:MAG: CRISPR-associated transcriptional regulator Csa3 [Thermoprotei archaeon]|nr:MAG: CRISPR-associated transcriptional regulator Csa3 [Thermoprotei archaeon]